MNSPTSLNELSESVGALVRDYVATTHATVLAAVERGYGIGLRSPKSPPSRPRASSTNSSRPPKAKSKRSPEVIANLANELYQCIAASPGGSMSMFAEQLGHRAVELAVPARMLKSQKRVRTTGVCQKTRYFAVPT